MYWILFVGSLGSTESASPTGSNHSAPPTYESDSGRNSYDSQSVHSAGSGGTISPHHRFVNPPQTGMCQAQKQLEIVIYCNFRKF